MNNVYIPKQSNIGNKTFNEKCVSYKNSVTFYEKYSSLGWGLVGMLTGRGVLAFLVVGMFGYKIL